MQQKQGRVRATGQMRGMGVNDDAGLEGEADRMGEAAKWSPESKSIFVPFPLQKVKFLGNGTDSRGGAMVDVQQNLNMAVTQLQATANATVIQHTKSDLTLPGLSEERHDSIRLLSALRQGFCQVATEILIESGTIEKEQQGYISSIFSSPPKIADHPLVLAFEQVVWEVIDMQLPALVCSLPFADAGAAIRFAQNLILERLRADPNMAIQDNARQAVEEFLTSSIKSLPVDSQEGKDEEVEADEEAGKAKVSDKRHNAAIARVGKLDPSKMQFDANIVKAGEEFLDRQTDYLAELLLEVPHAEDAIKQKDSRDAKKAEFKRLLNDAKKGEDPRNTDPVHSFIIKLAAKLEFKYAAEMLYLLRKAPVGDPVSAYRLQELLRAKYSKEFPVRFIALGEAPNDFASDFKRLGLLKDDDELIRKFRSAIQPSPDSQTSMPEDVPKMEDTFKGKRGEAKDADKREAARELAERNRELLVLFDRLTTSPPTLKTLADIAKITLPGPKDDKDRLPKSSLGKTFALHLFCTAIAMVEKRGSGDALLEAYEDFLAYRKLVPGNSYREKFVKQLETYKLLPGVDSEVLSHGAKSTASIIRDAVKGSWATKSEIDICSKLLGPHAFISILGSHMSRSKYGPLRSIIEQTMRHREAAAMAPPMTTNSLALDTNMIDILLPAIKDVPEGMRHRRAQLNKLIREREIRDIRLTNMNIAELGDYGRLIGRTLEVEVSETDIDTRKLAFLGVPYSKSRSSRTYSEIFKRLEANKVGENKGHADRSMMADLFLAERKERQEPTFASADLGVGEEIGTKEGQFNPEALGLPRLHIEVIETVPGEKLGPKSEGGDRSVGEEQDGGKLKATKTEDTPKKPADLSRDNSIYGFIVNGTHTVAEIAKIITDEIYGNPVKHFQLYVVGGAVRDYIRGSKIQDVDVKTNMPVDTLTALLDKHKLPYHVTFKDDLFLVTVSEDPHSLDIVCSKKTRKEFDDLYGKGDELDLVKDAQERDFTVNALYLDARKGFAPSCAEQDIEDPLNAGGFADARGGRLRFVADRGKGAPEGDTWAEVSLRERAERVVAHLIRHPEEFGRTLKFIERGHNEWFNQCEKPSKVGKRNEHLIGPYHLDAEVLDILRSNAALILAPLITEIEGDTSATSGKDVRKGASPAARKNYFLHKTGFETPMELVKVMQRLQFPPETIQMIIPDTVAGEFGSDGLAYDRNVSPRNRPTGVPKDWNPTAAPKVKVDMTNGELYQHRIYACLDAETKVQQFSKKSMGNFTKILIDVDFTTHAVPGHSAPHYHVFHDLNGEWVKNETGFSNTGQPGRPNVSFKDGVYIYYGPTPWLWRPKRAEGEDFFSILQNTCKAADLKLDKHDDGMVTIGSRLRIPLARLKQIDERDAGKEVRNKYRLPRLMMLIRTLQQGSVKKDDDSLKYFTQSKHGGERLRFKHQLDLVDGFLIKTCGFERSGKEISNLTHDDRLRLYDLISADYGELESSQAARYAMAQLGGNFSAARFVEYFEFYIAAVANRTSGNEVALLNKRMIKHSQNIVWSLAAQPLDVAPDATDDVIAKAIVDHGVDLRFTSDTAAAYHLNKHIEVTKVGPKDFVTNQGIKTAARAYMRAVQEAVSADKLDKVVHESDKAHVFFFKSDDVTAIIEAAQLGDKWNARILSCYGKEEDQDVVIDAPFFEGPSPLRGDREIERSARTESIHRTDFGVLRRVPTVNDGNCFFDAVRQSASLADNIGQLRTQAANAIKPTSKADQSWLGPFLTDQGNQQARLEALQSQVEQDRFWAGLAGDFVPYLMARALRRPIYILSSITGNLITVAGQGDNPIYVFYNGYNHYEASSSVG